MLVHGLPPRDYSHADIRRKRCQLCKAGPVVVLGARRKDRLDAIVKHIQGDGGKAPLRTVDVTKRRSLMSASSTQFTRFRDAARLHHWSVPTRAGGCWLPPRENVPNASETPSSADRGPRAKATSAS